MDGHACGQAHHLRTDQELVRLFDKGMKYRPSLGEDSVGRELERAVGRYVSRYFKTVAEAPQLRNILMDKLVKAIDFNRLGDSAEVTNRVQRKLKAITEDLKLPLLTIFVRNPKTA